MADDNRVGFRKIDIKKRENIESTSGNGIEDRVEHLNNKEAIPELDVAKLEEALDLGAENLEKKAEAITEPEDVSKSEGVQANEGEGELGGIVTQGQTTYTQKEREKKIEKILEGDIAEMYLAMPEDKRKVFKIKGEETSRAINNLIGGGKFKVKKVIDLIRAWLALIPGVNKFFLEKEVKIKADEIVRLNNINKER